MEPCKTVRILHSFPHQLGTGRIADTAWFQIKGVSEAGGDVTVFAASSHKPLPREVTVRPTLAWGRARVPFRLLGRIRALALHDAIVASRLPKLVGQIDVVHTWPLGALRTLKTAAQLGIPTVLERPNAHTRFAYEVVLRECERLGVVLPSGHEHAYNDAVLRIEEEEYKLAGHLLCPSDFVAKTFVDKGFAPDKLVRHSYGFDEKVYYPDPYIRQSNQGLSMLFAGVCAVRKGVHFALEAWLRSPACESGTFQIAGDFLPEYAEKLRPLLNHRSVRYLGFRSDLPDLMRRCDAFILPSIEEGSALVTHDARGSGCVLLVSEAAGANCEHMKTGLVHAVGDVTSLTRQITMLHEDRNLLERLREASRSTAREATWTAAGEKLLSAYREVILSRKSGYRRLQ